MHMWFPCGFHWSLVSHTLDVNVLPYKKHVHLCGGWSGKHLIFLHHLIGWFVWFHTSLHGFATVPWSQRSYLVVTESMAYAILDLTIRGSTRWPEIQTWRGVKSCDFRRHGDAVDICRIFAKNIKSTSFHVNFHQFSMLHPMLHTCPVILIRWRCPPLCLPAKTLSPDWRKFLSIRDRLGPGYPLHSVGWSSQTHWVQGCKSVFQPWRRCKS